MERGGGVRRGVEEDAGSPDLSKPASYAYDFDVDGTGTAATVARYVGRERKVLDVGAGSGAISAVMKTHYGCQVHAVERDDDAVAILETRVDRVYRADLNDIDAVVSMIEERYDTIVLADVLEHLYDPWKVLRRLKELLLPGGAIVVSLPHVGHASVLATILQGDFRYMEHGLLDKTHIRFFCKKNMRALFESAGLDVEAVEFILAPPDHVDFADAWYALPPEIRRSLRLVPMSHVYQIVLRTREAGCCSSPIDLDEIAPDVSSLVSRGEKKSKGSKLWAGLKAKMRRFTSGNKVAG